MKKTFTDEVQKQIKAEIKGVYLVGRTTKGPFTANSLKASLKSLWGGCPFPRVC